MYELRSPNVISAGAIMLSAHASRSLDSTGAYDRIKTKGYHFRDLTFRNTEHKLLDDLSLDAMVQEAGIEIMFEEKFSHVLSESREWRATFAFADGEPQTVDL
ncbi:hypothetical protein LTR36_008764 [Oleoguttula mirabilis]|uniref:Uncharacterized protein n=1 Tax=Oleoguttula mirabilis TaxID=1507867 RepID=A0AAV9JVB6_9PEZI|nr:hypothetical protein LTR36_008764 [Oleoguttula mirabilis]